MVLVTVRSLGSFLRIFSYSEMAFCSLPCWTYFSALARTFCLLKPNNAIRVRTPDPGLRYKSLSVQSLDASKLEGRAAYRSTSCSPRVISLIGRWTDRTRPIVRLDLTNRMV